MSNMSAGEKRANILSFILSKEFKKAATLCAQYEIESAREQENPFYGVQMLLYFVLGDLSSSRFVWKRIPKTIKVKTVEYEKIWAIGKALWLKNYALVYFSLNDFNWSQNHSSLINILREKFRRETAEILAKSYVNIKKSDLSSYLGLNENESVQYLLNLGWKLNDDNVYLSPCNNSLQTSSARASNINSLSNLTDFILFLQSN
eukprot:TRINITY_DN8455_c0_g1_i1.p1 TRINITY_DN8455_c0_g1~~TRINITY_DN8455_c0_g1_i1.p1  ORF type:complete len:219 (+),score=75.96 TRINITY_DN8455_c0_g1_i1:48-659(+)